MMFHEATTIHLYQPVFPMYFPRNSPWFTAISPNAEELRSSQGDEIYHPVMIHDLFYPTRGRWLVSVMEKYL